MVKFERAASLLHTSVRTTLSTHTGSADTPYTAARPTCCCSAPTSRTWRSRSRRMTSMPPGHLPVPVVIVRHKSRLRPLIRSFCLLPRLFLDHSPIKRRKRHLLAAHDLTTPMSPCPHARTQLCGARHPVQMAVVQAPSVFHRNNGFKDATHSVDCLGLTLCSRGRTVAPTIVVAATMSQCCRPLLLAESDQTELQGTDSP